MKLDLDISGKLKRVATDPSTGMRTPVLAPNAQGRQIWLHTKEREDDKIAAREIASRKNASLAAFRKATS